MAEAPPVSFGDIEDAFSAVYSGKTITTLDKGSVVVPVFVDFPDTEDSPDEEFPSIQFIFAGKEESLANADSDDNDDDAVSVDTGSVPYQETRRRSPVWYRVSYQLHIFTLDAAADRELMQWIETRRKPRSSLLIGADRYRLTRVGFTPNDVAREDRYEYHKVWTFVVIVPMEDVDNDYVESQVHTIQLRPGVVRTITKRGVQYPVDDESNRVEAVDAVFSLDRKIEYDLTDIWFPS